MNMIIGIYPRKSVYRDNSDSVQVQIQMCKEYAGILFKDYSIEFKIYDKDEGFSGKNMNRPAFKELMADVKADLLDAIIVYKLDRISRNVQEFSSMYQTLQQHNVSFISVKESFDTSSPMGRTVMYILAAFAQLERENTSERVSDNMYALGKAGVWTGGRLPSGMTSVRRRLGDKEHSYLLVDKSTIERVKLLYELILDGYPITRVERYCRDHGIKSQNGKFLNTSQIYNIITNPVYCQNSKEAYYYFKDLGCSLPDVSLFDGTKGLIGYGKTKTDDVNQKRQRKGDWNIAIGIHEPVVSSSDWIAVQKRLGSNKMFHAAKHESGILKGVIRCRCGARMDVRTYVKNNIMFSYYYCVDMARQGRDKCNSEYVRVNVVEDALFDELMQIRFNPERLHLKNDVFSDFQNSTAVRTEIRKLDSSIERLTSALMQADGSTAAGYIIKQIEELDSRKQTLQTELRRAELKESQDKTNADAEKEILGNICYLLDNFDTISFSGKNELIRKIIKKCTFDGENLDIEF